MCHVLIIEDDAIAAADIAGTLRRAGASSFSFASTEFEAVNCAREQRPGVVISDVMLASGFGPSAVGVIQGEFGPLPAIFVTATPDECNGCEAYRIFEKPFDPIALAQAFREVAPT